jgi:hypothetical protein
MLAEAVSDGRTKDGFWVRPFNRRSAANAPTSVTSDADCLGQQQGRRSFVDDRRLRCPQQDHSSAHGLQVGHWDSQRGQIQTNGYRRAPDSIKTVVSQTNADRRCPLLQLFISIELAARAPLQPLDLFHYSSLLSFALGLLAALASFIRGRRWCRRMSAPARHWPRMAEKKTKAFSACWKS